MRRSPYYRDPFRKAAGLTLGRIDQGIDRGVTADSPIFAPGRCEVVVWEPSSHGWPGAHGGPGAYIAVRLLKGRAKGVILYLAENITLIPAPGGRIKAAGPMTGGAFQVIVRGVYRRRDPIAILHPGFPNCEYGVATPDGTRPYAQLSGGYHEGDRTACGQWISDFTEFCGGKGGLIQNPKLTGYLPDELKRIKL